MDLSIGQESEDQWSRDLCIMSVKLSGDGKEVLAGTISGKLLVYDISVGQLVSSVANTHNGWINSVCFANRMHSNIIFSGGDDGMVKIWDQRAL